MRYVDYPRPLLPILIMMTASLTAIVGLERSGLIDLAWMKQDNTSAILIFCMLTAIYAAQWIVYFLSVNIRLCRVQTLRLLLWTETKQMTGGMEDRGSDLLREKSRNVITTQAIFIAISVFVISALLESGVRGLSFDQLNWENVSAYLALLLTTVSVMLLIISADASETTFNTFRENDGQVVGYFYKVSARRKYYGFVLSGLAILVFVSGISPAVGAIGMAVFILAGYPQWFPYLKTPDRVWVEMFILAVYIAGAAYAAHAVYYPLI